VSFVYETDARIAGRTPGNMTMFLPSLRVSTPHIIALSKVILSIQVFLMVEMAGVRHPCSESSINVSHEKH